jgi:Mechanosensitive ion channel
MEISFFSIISAKPTLFTVIFVLLLIGIEVGIRVYKNHIKNKYNQEKVDVDAVMLSNLTLLLNKRTQIVEMGRVLAYIVFILLMVLAYDVQAFSVMLLAIGAIVIVLKETVGSFFAYFMVVYQYDIGDDIKIDNILGEIIRVHTLATWVAGKEENGEYNGRLINVPNYKFFQSIVEMQELKMTSFRHVVIKAIYDPELFVKKFDTWLPELKAFLEETLPLRKLDAVGHFRGYAGTKYKINYTYTPEGFVEVRIAFVSSTATALTKKEAIFMFIESTKLHGILLNKRHDEM